MPDAALAIDTEPQVTGIKPARASAGLGAGFERLLAGLTVSEKPSAAAALATPGPLVSQKADGPTAPQDATSAVDAAARPDPNPIVSSAAPARITTQPGLPAPLASSPANAVAWKQPHGKTGTISTSVTPSTVSLGALPGTSPAPLGPAPHQVAVEPPVHPADDGQPTAHAPAAPPKGGAAAAAVAAMSTPSEPKVAQPDAASGPNLGGAHSEGASSPSIADQPATKLVDLIAPAVASTAAAVPAGTPVAMPSTLPAQVTQAPPPSAASPAIATAPPAQNAASQIAPALVHVGRTDTVQHLTIRLDPAELGRVEVRIERAATGPAKIELSAGRQDTLDLMRQDQPALHRALDQAGVPTEGRQVTFSLNPDLAGQNTGSGAAFSGHASFGGSPQPGGGQPAPRSAIPARAWRRAGLDVLA